MTTPGVTGRAAPRAAVVGGSLAGLSAAVALTGIGYEVEVLEASPRPLSSRGAGLVLQPDVEELLVRFAVVDPDEIATSCTSRQYLQPDGRASVSHAMPQRFTAWNALYRHLRAALGGARHQAGAEVVAVVDGEDAAAVHLADGRVVTADLVVGADGWDSTVRQALLPGVGPRDAGYVAWRGLVHEAELPAAVLRSLVDRFTFAEIGTGGHALCYLVPGVDGELAAGARRVNWVWYVAAEAGPELNRELTDAAGRRRALSVPPGATDEDFIAEVRARARRELPPVLSELVSRTAEPFVQAVVDLASPRMAWQRCALIGDAAFVPRPHTAAGTAKAAGDVLALADALAGAAPGREPEALRRWEPARIAEGRLLSEHGRRLGASLGLRLPQAQSAVLR